MIRSKKHLRFIASLPCITTGLEGSTQAAHIRSGFYGLGIKPDDSLVVPLSWQEHARQHSEGEGVFWLDFGGVQRAKDFAVRLYENTGDEFMCREILEDFRHG